MMEGRDDTRAKGMALWSCFLGAVGLLAVLAWQAWLSLALFGSDDPLQTLLDDKPVISGTHPQNQYLSHLGVQSLCCSGTFCVYDPSFQIGFPKTPIFNGSRIAEI